MITERLSKTCFNLCHGHQLVYNTCWEDPRLDQAALQLGTDDRVLVITSAGCNALDYALAAPRQVYAVDMNFRQNALLELKQAAIRALDYEDFFALFGCGRLNSFEIIYRQQLRPQLSEKSQDFWDRNAHLFVGTKRRESFYFRGTAGMFAWLMNFYIDRVAKIRGAVSELLSARSISEQQEIYERTIKPAFWGPFIRWVIRRDATLAMLGVPRSQRRQLDLGYPGGVAQFVEDRLDAVFSQMPIADNYFWRVYLTGEYTPNCCPSYLKENNFQCLKEGLVDCISTHTDTILGFLSKSEDQISRFVLLDHMDWLHENHQEILRQQWQGVIDRAAPDARVIWRSAALKVDFVDPIEVRVDGERTTMGEVLRYDRPLAARLHAKDRVNTYASFYIADILSNSSAVGSHEIDSQIETDRENHDEYRSTTQDALFPGLVAHSR